MSTVVLPAANDQAVGTAAIDVRGLVKRYAESSKIAVDDVSFDVARGEIFGLLGPNGAGKSTTIGILTTMIVPTGGTATIAGADVVRDPINVKRRIAVVPQINNLDRRLPARDILTFHGAYHSMPKKVRERRADQLLEELGLAERAKEKVSRYSGGMAQRLMIARALMHSPEVLFLDEPTNNLDPQSRLFLWERIRDLNAGGMTLLLTTHDMDEANRLCNRIAIMDQGKILANDTPAELKKLLPGGTSLEIRAIAQDSSFETRNLIRTVLASLPGVAQVDVSEEVGGSGPNNPQPELNSVTCRIYAESARTLVGPAAQALIAAGAEVRDIRVKQPTLEEVFITMTGRQLR